MCITRVFSGLAAALIVLCLSGTAQAVHGPYSVGYGELWWGYYSTGTYAPHLPYYALYPPVYYSHPTARPYGQSPFAYPPVAAVPCASSETPAPAATCQPLRITNPYVTQGLEAPAQPKADATAKPLVVYPASREAKPL